ncbi:RING-type domain-containing protein [Meloidogyne graminicola]|uniref:RING-type domain-containing protein n=1 Tax=Meloidogyne graminicola TaxID=189291 RepID=A0A8S9ZYM9_9BILA|nr:RING-type domain-containing protein [Meloidogyne graminicola]
MTSWHGQPANSPAFNLYSITSRSLILKFGILSIFYIFFIFILFLSYIRENKLKGMKKIILFNNNEHSCLFSQPLSYSSFPPSTLTTTTNTNINIFFSQSPIQSPPPEIMSSSNISSPTAFYFPNSASIIKQINNNDLANNESEFPFLESKPSLLNQRLLKGGGKPLKGRRNAAETLWRRRLANQAFLVRSSSGGCGNGNKSNLGSGWYRRKGFGNELRADYCAPYVFYSIKQKSRWLRDGIDWLYELSEGYNGKDLCFSLAETNYSLNGNQYVQAFHSFDIENNYLQTKISKSKKGAILADLQKSLNEENNENEIPKKQLNFHIIKPNILPKEFCGKTFTRKKIYSNYCTKSSITKINSNNNLIKQKRHLNLIESEPEEENEFLAQYRPKRETYSLADFIKKNNNLSSTSIINRRKRCCSSLINLNSNFENSEDGQYTIVPQMEFIELPDENDNNILINNKQNKIIQSSLLINNNNKKQQQQQLLLLSNNQLIINSLHQQINNKLNNNNLLNIICINYLTNISKYSFKWKTQLLGDNLFLIDLSSEIKITNELLFVLIISKSQIFINSLINLDEQKIKNIFLNKTTNDNIEEKILILLKIVKAEFIEWEINQKQKEISSFSSFEYLRNIYNTPKLALPSKSISINSILNIQREELNNDESLFVWTENLNNNNNNKKKII